MSAVLVCTVVLVFSALNSQAEEKKIAVNLSTIKDNLYQHVGKRVELVLRSGVKISGIVAKVGDHIVHIEKLSGKEFYDAALKIGSIDAVVFRARGNR